MNQKRFKILTFGKDYEETESNIVFYPESINWDTPQFNICFVSCNSATMKDRRMLVDKTVRYKSDIHNGKNRITINDIQFYLKNNEDLEEIIKILQDYQNESFLYFEVRLLRFYKNYLIYKDNVVPYRSICRYKIDKIAIFLYLIDKSAQVIYFDRDHKSFQEDWIELQKILPNLIS